MSGPVNECLCCRGQLSAFGIRAGKCLLRRCGRCGTMATFPIWTHEQALNHYTGHSSDGFDRDAQLSQASARIEAIKVLLLRKASRLLDYPLELRGLRILDVGAGSGGFVRTMNRLGHEALGLEPGLAGPAILRTDLASYAEQVRDSGVRWDLVTMWDSLEHLQDPRRGLQDALSLLRPGGMALIKVPASGLPFLRFVTRGLFQGGLKASDLALPGHRFHFSLDGLKALASGVDPAVQLQWLGFSIPFQPVNSNGMGLARLFFHFLLSRMGCLFPRLGEIRTYHLICLRKREEAGS